MIAKAARKRDLGKLEISVSHQAHRGLDTQLERETARTSSRSAAAGHRCHGRRVDEYEPVGYYVFSNSIYKGATEVKT